jgi:HEAT repeat protein
MRQFIVLGLFIVLSIGCGKKQPPASEPADADSKGETPPPEVNTAANRTKLVNNVKSSNQKFRRDAAEELSGLVDTDPEAITALLELLKDKTTSGQGKIIATQINSTREAAARALLAGGPKGETALKDKGFAILREGLRDPQPAIREHTAYTIGHLGPFGRPLSADVMKLCKDPDTYVYGSAFDALSLIGVTDVPGFVALLNDENREIGKLAAEQVPTFTDIPSAAIPPLTVALGNEDTMIRQNAAAALMQAGPKAAAATGALVEAIKKSYPNKFDLTKPYEPGGETVYWSALAGIGEAAVTPTAELLGHTNAIVRAYAAETLGEIGAPAKPAADKLKAALKDRTISNVSIEAACALCAIGEGKPESVELVKQLIEFPDVTAQFAIAAIPRMGEAGKPAHSNCSG